MKSAPTRRAPRQVLRACAFLPFTVLGAVPLRRQKGLTHCHAIGRATRDGFDVKKARNAEGHATPFRFPRRVPVLPSP